MLRNIKHVNASFNNIALIVAILFGLFIMTKAGICWEKRMEGGKCKQPVLRNVTKEYCCGFGPDVGYTEREMNDYEWFFATTIGDGTSCTSCIESCETAKCGQNKRCAIRSGQPKCICSPICRSNVDEKRGRTLSVLNRDSGNNYNKNKKNSAKLTMAVDMMNFMEDTIITTTTTTKPTTNLHSKKDQRKKHKRKINKLEKNLNSLQQLAFQNIVNSSSYVDDTTTISSMPITITANNDRLMADTVDLRVVSSEKEQKHEEEEEQEAVELNDGEKEQNLPTNISKSNARLLQNKQRHRRKQQHQQQKKRFFQNNLMNHQHRSRHHASKKRLIAGLTIENSTDFEHEFPNIMMMMTTATATATTAASASGTTRTTTLLNHQNYHHRHQQLLQHQQIETTAHGQFLLHNPVCGTDGKTYKTECQLKKRACRREITQLTVAYRGQCQTTCRYVNCPNSMHCLEDQNHHPHCVNCTIACPPHHEYRKSIQPNPSRLVCGADGLTYRNLCEIKRAACLIGKSIPVAYRGPCKEIANCNNIKCKDRQTCLNDLITHRPRCVSCSFKCPRRRHQEHFQSGVSGKAADTKICGTNEITYNSWCQMLKDSCHTRYFIDAKHSGACTK